MSVESTAPAPRDFRVCAVVPTYDNPATIGRVVEGIRAAVDEVIVVDDGSGPAGRAAVATLAAAGAARIVHRERNGGKGAAVKTGFVEAARRGYTHVLQVDADGQHDLGDVATLLDAARRHPDALVLGAPRYDASAPLGRRFGRKLTLFWTNFATAGRVIEDPMCGFRVYPLARALAAGAAGDRMDFDIEIAVRMVWGGARVVNVPTAVRYLTREEGGVSHFRMLGDNVRISWLHTRLAHGALLRVLILRPLRRLLGRA